MRPKRSRPSQRRQEALLWARVAAEGGLLKRGAAAEALQLGGLDCCKRWPTVPVLVQPDVHLLPGVGPGARGGRARGVVRGQQIGGPVGGCWGGQGHFELRLDGRDSVKQGRGVGGRHSAALAECDAVGGRRRGAQAEGGGLEVPAFVAADLEQELKESLAGAASKDGKLGDEGVVVLLEHGAVLDVVGAEPSAIAEAPVAHNPVRRRFNDDSGFNL